MKDMARPRNTIANMVWFKTKTLLEIMSKMSDSELGAWLRKAANDCVNGCTAPDVDPFVKQSYEASLAKMLARQNIDAQKYLRRLARNGKIITAIYNDQETTDVSTPETISANEASNPPTRESETRGPQTDKFNGDAATSDGAETVQPLERGSLEFTTISNISQDAPNGNAGDERDHRGNTGLPESSTSAKNFTLDSRTDKDRQPTRQSRRTGGTPKRVEMPTASHAETLPVRSPAELKKPYGTCGHVMLTDTEGRHLREVYGPHLAIAIDILDGYIENDGKAAKKYKNHAAVLRKGNWVWNKVQEMILNEKRIENASKGAKNWKAEERERTARVLRGESADGKCFLRDDELTPEELEAKYG